MLGPLTPAQARDFAIADWNLLRALVICRAVDEERWLDAPSSHSFSRDAQMVNWYRAKALVGLLPLSEVARSHSGRSRYSREELLDALERCASSIQRLPSQTDYENWRRAELVARLPEQPDLFIPSHGTLALQLCQRVSWSGVIEAGLRERANLRTLQGKQGDESV